MVCLERCLCNSCHSAAVSEDFTLMALLVKQCGYNTNPKMTSSGTLNKSKPIVIEDLDETTKFKSSGTSLPESKEAKTRDLQGGEVGKEQDHISISSDFSNSDGQQDDRLKNLSKENNQNCTKNMDPQNPKSNVKNIISLENCYKDDLKVTNVNEISLRLNEMTAKTNEIITLDEDTKTVEKYSHDKLTEDKLSNELDKDAHHECQDYMAYNEPVRKSKRRKHKLTSDNNICNLINVNESGDYVSNDQDIEMLFYPDQYEYIMAMKENSKIKKV